VSASDRPTFTIAYDSPTVPLDHSPTVQCRSPSTLPLRHHPRGHLTFYGAPSERGSLSPFPLPSRWQKSHVGDPIFVRPSLSSPPPFDQARRLGGVYLMSPHPRHSGRECSCLLRIHAMEAIRNLFASWSPIVRYSKDAGRMTTATLLCGDRLHFPGLMRGSDCPAAGNPQGSASEKYHEGVQAEQKEWEDWCARLGGNTDGERVKKRQKTAAAAGTREFRQRRSRTAARTRNRTRMPWTFSSTKPYDIQSLTATSPLYTLGVTEMPATRFVAYMFQDHPDALCVSYR
jgi:hypothetical protein